uniref:gap junction alpha-3 protein-like n=1 Tax=Myxine glutinosa TaxID=7769 RepID=UPI00358E0380
MAEDWEIIASLFRYVKEYSIVVGKVWLVILFVLRILVLTSSAEYVWGDEQSDFICNTKQPGCENACYDKAFPISHIRFWVLQVIFVSTPGIFYGLHELEVRTMENKKCKDCKRKEKPKTEAKPRYLEKPLLTTYVLSIISRILLELAFIFGQYWLYGFHLDLLYKCRIKPCPNIVDCFVSRPTEKTIFIRFMLTIACVSLLVSLVELVMLSEKLHHEETKKKQPPTPKDSDTTPLCEKLCDDETKEKCTKKEPPTSNKVSDATLSTSSYLPSNIAPDAQGPHCSPFCCIPKNTNNKSEPIGI